jgi:hypothetical protein
MSKAIKSKNIAEIKLHIVKKLKKDTSGQGCMKKDCDMNRVSLYKVTSKKGTENLWHMPCFREQYGDKTSVMLAEFIPTNKKFNKDLVEEKPKKISKKNEETSEGIVEETSEGDVEIEDQESSESDE